jgi:hypothetical protein
MSTTEQPKLTVIENTRLITVRLADGVTAESFVNALNNRRVKIDGDKLTDGYTAEELGVRVEAVNASDYKLSRQTAEFDTLDPYDFKYNEI